MVILKGLIGRTYVHHNLCIYFRYFIQPVFYYIKRKYASVNFAHLSPRTIYGNLIPSVDNFSAVAGTDYAGNSEFTGNDSGMGSTPALVGNNRRGYFHNRFPVRVSNFSYQHLSFLEFVYLSGATQNPNFACAYLRPYGDTGNHNVSPFFKFIFF